MKQEIKEGAEIFIVSQKLKQTYAPFQKVAIMRLVEVPENQVTLVQVRCLNGEYLWFGLAELTECSYLYERLISLAAGKRACMTGLKPQETWDELMTVGYKMQLERDTLAQADRYTLLPLRLS